MRNLLLLILFFGSFASITAQVSITFQIDMSYQVELGRFNPATEWVEVAGTFNSWNGSGRFSDDNQDLIYELTIGGFQAGENIEYKFRYNGKWDGREEFPGLGNNRAHLVGTMDETLFHWYNNDTPPDANLVADFHTNLREFYEQGIIQFNDRSSGQVERWEWVFEGGTPSTSTLQNPIVRYNEPGKYKVELRVFQEDKEDVLSQTDFVTVLPRNTENIPWWNETVFYEIFVRSFKDSDGDGIGDFKGLTEKLDYLNDGDDTTTDDLGITGIWLMPIHEAGSYHGYDVIDYKSVNAEHGGMNDFRLFLEEAHKRGIKVIIDLVLNHNSSQSEWFQNARTGRSATYRNFYRWSDNHPGFNGPWGQNAWHWANGDYYYGIFWDGMPDLNYEEPQVKEAMFDVADFWLEDIGVDGFRLDAVKYILEEGQRQEDTQSTFTFWKEFTSRVKAANPDAFSVGEAWTSTENVVNYVKDDRIDYCFEFDLAGNILYSVNEGKVDNLYTQVQKMYNIYPHLQYGTFLANHDQNRIMDSFGNNESKIKAAAALYLTLPGIPYIYYGEEIGMSGVKPDEDIRLPMQWNNARHAGFTDGTPWRGVHFNYREYNVEKEASEPNSLLNWYKQLIQLRNNEPALQLGTYEAISTNEDKVFAFLRSYQGENLLVIHNLGTSVVRDLALTFTELPISNGAWKVQDLLSTDNSYEWNAAISNQLEGLVLGGRRSMVLKFDQLVSNKEIEIANKIKVFPNPASTELHIELVNSTAANMTYQIHDLKGSNLDSGSLIFQDGRATITLQKLIPGLYELQLYNGENPAKIRFIKGN